MAMAANSSIKPIITVFLLPILSPTKPIRTSPITIVPPKDIEPGKYEVQHNAVTEYQSQKVESTDKNVSVIIKTKTNLLGTFILIVILVGMVVGVAVFTIKITRR